MLTRLFIQNLATVEKQIVEFTDGFTVLTGETGAGKSVLIKAIGLLSGNKCPKDLIRADEKFLSVEALFAINNNQAVVELLRELDIEHDGELSIRRKVYLSGKNSIFINDYSSNLAKLTLFSNYLLDLHGQHSQQSLLKTSTHIEYLDEFVGVREKVTDFKNLLRNLNQKRKLSEDLTQNSIDRNRKIDFIHFQIDEIDNAGFAKDEEIQLNEEAGLLNNADLLISALTPIAGWSSNENSPLTIMSAAQHTIEDVLSIDSGLRPVTDEIQSGLITLEEAVSEINQYLLKLEVNPRRLEDINSRLSELDKLKRKYGKSLEEIFDYRDSLSVELDKLENIEISYSELEKEIDFLTSEIEIKASEISKLRKRGTRKFEKLVFSSLGELGLERSKFVIDITHLPRNENSIQAYTSRGMDQVEFLIATNPGNPLKPLVKVASGGEISRIMLAIKTTLNEDISTGTMIFDEIDAGISGRVAETVGIKLVKLGLSRQVICITHSPQIAAKANNHHRVEKIFRNNSSKTHISHLKGNERVKEIARFLGGNEISAKTLSVARELLTE